MSHKNKYPITIFFFFFMCMCCLNSCENPYVEKIPLSNIDPRNIVSKYASMSRANFSAYTDSIKGKRIKWFGNIRTIEKHFLCFGRYKIEFFEKNFSYFWVFKAKIDLASYESTSIQVFFSITKQQAAELQNNDLVEFTGLISNIEHNNRSYFPTLTIELTSTKFTNDSLTIKEHVEKDINKFISSFSSELLRKIEILKKKQIEAKSDIIELQKLNENFPSQSKLIKNSMQKLKDIELILHDAINKITNEVETAYVAFRIDEIKGKKSFNIIKNSLIDTANQALSTSEQIRLTMEERINE